MDLVGTLAAMPLFHGLAPEDLEPLVPKLRPQSFRKGEFVWLEGDPGHVVQLLVRGRIKTARVSYRGDELVVQYESPGALLGLPAALADGASRMTQGEAMEDTEVLAIDREEFLVFLERTPAVMRRVLDDLARTTRAALGTLSAVGFLDVHGRVVQKLLDLAELYGEQTPEGMRIGIKLSQRALGGMVAASREKVNRVLARLAADGIIRQEGGSITILAPDRLRVHP